MKKYIKNSLVVLSFIGILSLSNINTAFASFTYSRSITIDHTKVGTVNNTDQSNFPVLVSLTDATLKDIAHSGHVQSSTGYDIYFYSDSGLTTRLPVEREKYDATAGTYIGWVKVPTVSHTSDTVIYMGYGDNTISTDPNSDGTYGATSVWDTNYKGVWHLPDGTTLNLNNSLTGSAATNHGTTATTGNIDGGANFASASSQYIDAGPVFDSPTAVTVSAWYKPASFPNAFNDIFSKHTNANGHFDLYIKSNGKLALYVLATTTISYDGTGTNTLTAGNWYYVTMTYDSTNGLKGYVNGAIDGSAAANGAMAGLDTSSVYIGQDIGTDVRYINAALDEVRYSNVARSADWVKTEYNNQSAPGDIGAPNFYTVGSESGGSATTFTFTGPSSGNVNSASTNFTVTPVGGNYTGTITITPSGAGVGSLSPTVLTFSSSSAAQTFTITPDASGSITLTPTNNQSLTNPSNLTYTANAVVPGAPTGATATAGNTQATVTFTAPASNGGASISGYTVTSIPAGGTDSNAGSTGLSHVVTGLTNGTSYTFTVHATNSVGNSSESSASNAVTPATGSATTFTFTGPSSGNVNSASTNFTVTPVGGNYTGTITITPSGAGVGSLSPTVLTFSSSSAAQTFTITPDASGSITLTPTNNQSLTNPSNLTYTANAVVPGAPTGATATAGNTQATVTFTAPASNGGASISGYTVTSIPAGGTDSNAGSTGLSHVVTGLTNGTSYTFTVHATNSVGNSSESSASNAVTPATIPGAPTSATAFAGNTQATVTFTAPASNGGASIDGYTVTSIPAGGTDSNAGSTGLSHVVTGLTNGTSYTFTVTAHNSVGNSSASSASNAVTPNPPAVITRVHVPASSVPCSKGTNGSTALTCSTDVPPTVGDSLIVFVYAGGSGSSTTVTDNATGGSNTYTQQVQSTTGITGLRQYTAPITRTNAGTFTVTVTPSGSATLDVWFAEYAGVDTTQVDDTASGATGASGIRQCGSNDTLTTTNANDLIVAILSAGGATPLTVDSANSTYTMSALYTPLTLGYGGFMDKIESSTVSGLNLKFDGATGQSSTCAVGAYKAAAGANVPGAPTGATATGGNAQATVTFTAPASNGGASITGYTVTSIPAGGTDSNAGSTGLSHVVTGLTNGTSYTFTVHATNSAGNSSESSASNAVTPNPPAATSYTFTGPSSGNVNSASTNFTVTPVGGNYTGTITLTPTGGFGLSATVLTFSNSSAAQTFTITPTNGGSITLTPTNNGSLTNPSNLTYTANAVVPGAPTGATATGGNAQATVTFTAPASNGGATITGYTVTSIPAGGTDSNASSTSLSHIVTGLTNGTSYTFTVKASNSAGQSAASSASNAVTPNIPFTLSRVQSSVVCLKATSNTNALTCSVTTPPVVGDSIVLSVLSLNAQTSLTVTDNAVGGTNTYTVEKDVNSANIMRQIAATVSRTSSGTFTITVTPSSATPLEIYFTEYSGVDITQVDTSDASSTGAGVNRTCSPSFTTTNATDLIVANMTSFNGSTLTNAGTIPLNVVISGTGNAGQAVGMMDLIASSVYNVETIIFNSAGSSGSSTYCAVVAYKAATATSATTFTLTGPSSGNVNSASTNFTVTPNGLYAGTITLTPTGGFGLSPIVLTFSNSLIPQTFTITPTTAGSITLTPTNNGGLINPSNLTYTSNAIVPGAPTGATATGGNTQATVTFTAPASNGGASIDGYTVTSIPAGGIDSNAGTTGLSHVVTGLTNGTSYTFTVTAHNFVGNSSASSASNAVTPNPPAATSYTFTGPSSGNVNSASTNFTVTPVGGVYTGTITITPSGAGSAGLSPTVLTFSNSSSAQTFTITPTAGGSITLTPTNNGSLTNPSNLTYTANPVVPGAPTGATATGGNAQATVTFTAPASNGGASITGYTVTSIPAGGTDSNAGSTGLSHVVTGLTNGTSYTFTVKATNSAGQSAASSASNAVTPNASSATTFTFTGPSSGNVNSASTNFTVTPVGGVYTGTITLTPTGGFGLSARVLTFSNSSTAQTFTITPTNGGSITLTPTNNGGLTNPSNLTYTANAVVPGAPTGATATGGNAQATITFTAPASNGGATITGYTVSAIPSFGVDTNAGSTSLSHLFTGIANGVPYTFTVHATNSAGNSAESAQSNSITPSSSTHTLSGTIKYYDGIKLVPTATVTLEDGSSNVLATTTTDVNGVYSFSNVADGGNYIVVASKTDGNGAENSADQIKIGRHIVGLETFDTIYKNISGDVNNDGSLSSADQIKIGRNIVGLDVNLPSGAWKFYASNVTPTTGNYLFTGLSRTYTNLTADQTNQDFVGIKMGDVNNSW